MSNFHSLETIPTKDPGERTVIDFDAPGATGMPKGNVKNLDGASLTRTVDCRTMTLRFPVMSTRIERLEARVSGEQKRLFQKAADLEGRTLTDFMIHAIQEAAHNTLRRHQVLRLSTRDQRTFVNALLKPPAPSRRLRAAAERYKKLTATK